MTESTYGMLFLLIGIIAAALLLFFGNYTSKDERNYYLLKEATKGAMLDAVDENAYQVGLTEEEVEKNPNTIKCVSGKPGTIRIVKEKFVESFIRRYSDTAQASNGYTMKFYEIQECPPKVSVRVWSTESTGWIQRIFSLNEKDLEEAKIVNDLSAILESRK